MQAALVLLFGLLLSHDSADSQLPFNFARAVAVGESGEVHAVWFDTRTRYRRSLDDGRTWMDEVTLSTDGVISQQAAIAASGRNVYVAWHELREGRPRIVFRRSTDSGMTWQPPQMLTGPAIASAHPSIAAAGSRVHITWFDGRHGLTEIYTKQSNDFGVTWQQEQRISQSEAESWVATVEAQGNDVYIGWVDYADANEEEYLRRSNDGGITWGPITRMTIDEADSWAPPIALSGESVHFCWFDRRDAGVTDAQIEVKLNEALMLVGLPASAPPARDPRVYYLNPLIQRLQQKRQMLSQAAPQWVAAGGDLRRLEATLREFEQLMQQWSFAWEIYCKHSQDRGATFGPDRRVTFAAGPSQRPSVTASGAQVGIVWFDQRDADGQSDVYVKFSSDAGLSWSADQKLSTSAAGSVLPSVGRSAGALHVIWVEGQPGEIRYLRIPSHPRERAVRR